MLNDVTMYSFADLELAEVGLAVLKFYVGNVFPKVIYICTCHPFSQNKRQYSTPVIFFTKVLLEAAA